MRLDIKPLSVNEAWQGKRFKTKIYKAYESHVLFCLKPMEIPEGKIELQLTWGFSNKGADADNPIKPFVDCLQKKYGFNDNKVYSYVVKKVDVKKGEEFIEFNIKGIEQ